MSNKAGSKHNLGIAFIQGLKQALDPLESAIAELLREAELPSADADAPPRKRHARSRRTKEPLPMAPESTSVQQHAPPSLAPPPASQLIQSTPLPVPSLPSKEVHIIPLDIARDVFDIAIAPILIAPSPFAQSVRQHMYRRMFLTIVSAELINLSSVVSPESLYMIILNALQQLGLSQ